MQDPPPPAGSPHPPAAGPWRRLARRIRRAPRRWVAATVAVAAILVAAGVYVALPGGQPAGPTSFPTHTITIYASLPLEGPQGAVGRAVLAGFQAGLAARVAADGGQSAAGGQSAQIGNYRIRFVALDDATVRGWSPEAVRRNALEAARNPSTVLYLGDLDSGATAISLPILNQAGIAQITPGSGYVGLTQAVTGVTGPLQPAAFYPSRIPTLFRLIPDDMVQAGAMLHTLRHNLGCEHVAALSQGSALDGPALVNAIHRLAGAYKLTFVATKFGKHVDHAAIDAYALSLKELDIGCFVLAGLRTRTTVKLVETIRATLPHVPIIASSGLCTPAFTDTRRGGVPPAVAGDEVYCVSPTLPLATMSSLPGTDVRQFIQDYERYSPGGSRPSPYAVNGFVAAEMMVESVIVLGEGTDRRVSVRNSLVQGVQSLPLGDVAFDRYGNSTVLYYGLYRIGAAGRSEFVRTVDVDGAT